MILTCEFCKEGERFNARDPMQMVIHLEGHVRSQGKLLDLGFKRVSEIEEEVKELSKEKREKKK